MHRTTEQAIQAQRLLNTELDISRQLGRQFGHALTTAFVGIAVQGKSLGDVLRSLAQGLSKLALNAAFKPLENIVGNALQGLLTGSLGQTAGLSLAAGTPQPFTGSGIIAAPQALPFSQATLASGAGPFSPPAGAVGFTPASGSAAGPRVHVTFHVTSPDAESFRRSETQIAAMLARTVGNGQRNL